MDGHNRYKICKAHKIAFETVQRELTDRDAVKAQAQQRMLAGRGDPKEKLPEGQTARRQSRDELGAMAGVSGKTYEHAAQVLDEAPAPIANAMLKGELSISAAHKLTKMPAELQTKIAERIEGGESPKKVVSEVKTHARKSKAEQAKADAEYANVPPNTEMLQPPIDEQSAPELSITPENEEGTGATVEPTPLSTQPTNTSQFLTDEVCVKDSYENYEEEESYATEDTG